jgi:hypothetical protein
VNGLRSLHAAVVLSWDADTAAGEWHELVPDLNQCLPTALVVQDHFGGDILMAKISDGDKHFWNRLPDGREVDFTRSQFDYLGVAPYRAEARKRGRNTLLRVKHVRERYSLLKGRVDRYLPGLTEGSWERDG